MGMAISKLMAVPLAITKVFLLLAPLGCLRAVIMCGGVPGNTLSLCMAVDTTGTPDYFVVYTLYATFPY
jgi:hypothetical protein